MRTVFFILKEKARVDFEVGGRGEMIADEELQDELRG
jgi:hypothetical protein